MAENWAVVSQKPLSAPADPWALDDGRPSMRSGPPISPDWSEVPGKAWNSLSDSALKTVKDMAQPFLHPVDTAGSLKDLAVGTFEKAVIPGRQPREAYPEALADFFVERLGSIDAIKRTLSTDPVGFFSDLGALMTGVGGLAKTIPGVAGKVAGTVGKVGSYIDPIQGTGKAFSYVGEKAVPELIGRLGTHTGGESIRQAFAAGKEGGQRADLFQGNMRGDILMPEVVDLAKNSLEAMRKERGKAYRSGMAGVSRDPTILDFAPIDKALSDASDIGVYRGKSGISNAVDIDPAAAPVREKLTAAIEEWRNFDPREFHTVEGIDALKRKIGSIRDGTPFGSPERVAANEVYRAVRGQIVQQAPAYGKVMKDYETASDLIEEIGRSLSLNPKASVDTSLRKLQSIMRNNASTNYGNRIDLIGEMPDAQKILPQLAGQSLNTLTPRGLGALTASGTAGAGLTSTINPVAAGALLAAQSPRLMGEASYYAGKLAKGGSVVGKYVPPEILARALDQFGNYDRSIEDRGVNRSVKNRLADVLLNSR